MRTKKSGIKKCPKCGATYEYSSFLWSNSEETMSFGFSSEFQQEFGKCFSHACFWDGCPSDLRMKHRRKPFPRNISTVGPLQNDPVSKPLRLPFSQWIVQNKKKPCPFVFLGLQKKNFSTDHKTCFFFFIFEKKNKQMFLQAIQRGYFALYWEPALHDVSTVNHGCQGAIGRYGPGYGHEEHQKDIARKYGILEPGFIWCDELELHFTIQNRNRFDFLCRFAQEHGYDKPVLQTTRVKGRVIDAVQSKEAFITNERIKKHVGDLVYELSRLTTAEIDDDFEILTLVDTDPFYEWNTKEMYPISYTIIERDTERVRKIWFDSNIMRDC